ncbi:MAG TPA: hypothetical protein VGH27_11720 [Streptosporangiaceae bacterium]|jgi:hypothetical protein
MTTFGPLAKLAGTTLTAAVIAVTLASSTAMAGPAPYLSALTWTVTPGGSFTGKAVTSTVEDTTSGATITCKSATMTGSLKSGSGLPGKGLGTIKSLTFGSCLLDGVPYSVSSGATDWSLNAASYNAASGGKTFGNISRVHFALSGPNCSAVVDGTSGTADNGKVKFNFANKTRALKIPYTGDTLHVWDVTGCSDGPGGLTDGDTMTVGTCPAVNEEITATGSGPGPAMTGPPCR